MEGTVAVDKADVGKEGNPHVVMGGDEIEKEDDEASTLSAFNSQLNNSLTSKKLIVQRQAYEERLRSFQAVTYMFKPSCLSPIICARFGYVSFQLQSPFLLILS